MHVKNNTQLEGGTKQMTHSSEGDVYSKID